MGDVTFVLRPKQASTLSGETINVQIEIFNHGSSIVRLPNPMEHTSPVPHYRLRGPDGAAATFTPRSRLRYPATEPPRLIELPPGGGWRGEIALDAWADVRASGEYVLDATIEWESLRLVATEVKFSVRALRLRGLALVDHHPRTLGMFHATTVQREGNRYSAAAFYVSEVTHHGLDLEIDGVLSIGELKEPPSSLAPIYSSDVSATVPLALIGTTSQELIVVPFGASEFRVPAPMPLRGVLRALIRPGESSGPTALDALLVFDGTSADLGHLHVSDLDRGASAPLRTIASLGPGFVAADATRGGLSLGAPMVVASLTSELEGAKATFRIVSSSGEIVARSEVLVPDVLPFPAIAVHVDRSGRVDASFVAHPRSVPERAVGNSPRLVEMQGTLADLPTTSRSSSIDAPGQIRQVLIDYGSEREPYRPGVFLRTDTTHWFLRPGRKAFQSRAELADKDEIALLGVRCWYLIVNDGSRVKRHRLDC